jgi:hypothetical protein
MINWRHTYIDIMVEALDGKEVTSTFGDIAKRVRAGKHDTVSTGEYNWLTIRYCEIIDTRGPATKRPDGEAPTGVAGRGSEQGVNGAASNRKSWVPMPFNRGVTRARHTPRQ